MPRGALGVGMIAMVAALASCRPSSLAEARAVPADAPVADECDDAPADARRMTVVAPDGLEIGVIDLGDVAAPVALVLVHGWGQDACVFLPVATTLTTKPDVRVLTLDLRDRGATAGDRNDTDAYPEDVVAVIDRARADGASDVVLLGTSVGAATALVAGGTATPTADAVVAVSPPGAIGSRNVISTLAPLDVPIFMVSSEGDGPFLEAQERIAAEVASVRQATVLDGSLHGMRLLLSDAQAEILQMVDAAVAEAVQGNG